MTTSVPPDLAAMMTAAEIEWRANAPKDWATIGPELTEVPPGTHKEFYSLYQGDGANQMIPTPVDYSRSNGIGVHDPPESAVMPAAACQRCRARTGQSLVLP